mgnify:FL=1
MAAKLYPDAQLEALRGFPAQIAADDLARYFTLLPADTSFINAHRGDGNRIGVAVALCTLAWLGFVPDDLRAAPAAAVSRVAAGRARCPENRTGTLCRQIANPYRALARGRRLPRVAHNNRSRC